MEPGKGDAGFRVAVVMADSSSASPPSALPSHEVRRDFAIDACAEVVARPLVGVDCEGVPSLACNGKDRASAVAGQHVNGIEHFAIVDTGYVTRVKPLGAAALVTGVATEISNHCKQLRISVGAKPEPASLSAELRIQDNCAVVVLWFSVSGPALDGAERRPRSHYRSERQIARRAQRIVSPRHHRDPGRPVRG